VLRLEALIKIEGHLRPRRDTCDPEGRKQGPMVTVVQVVIMEQNEDLAVGVFLLKVKCCCVREASVPHQLQVSVSSSRVVLLEGSCSCP
jgi:hypothetical protein